MSGPKRGEIYYVSIPYQTGTEMAKDRPGVVISADKVNATYGHVMVCWLTSASNYGRIERVTVRATGKLSAVICEQIATVDKSRVRDYLGTVSAKEMERIEAGIRDTLGLDISGADNETEKYIAGLEGELRAYKAILGERRERGDYRGDREERE